MLSKDRCLFLFFYSILSVLLSIVHADEQQILIEDPKNNIRFEMNEIKQIIHFLSKEQKKTALDDKSVLVNMINQIIIKKNIAAEFAKISKENDPAEYWKYQFAVLNFKSGLYLDFYQPKIEMPDLSKLAQERYITNKVKYAGIPEKRKASQILISCPPGCDRQGKKRDIAEEVLLTLKYGGDFEGLVKKYSDDPITKNNNGSLGDWLVLGQPKVDGYLLQGVFGIPNILGYSEIVETRRGFHIIRLDELQGKKEKDYEEVKGSIVESIKNEYINLKTREKMSSLEMSDDVKISIDEIQELIKEAIYEK